MANRNNILMISSILGFIGFFLIIFGFNYNNSDSVEFQNKIAEIVKTEQDYNGTYCIGGGVALCVLSIVLFFKSKK